MFIKQFDQLGEIGERAGETVDLIHRKLLSRRPDP
jgi:hypothetical protein